MEIGSPWGKLEPDSRARKDALVYRDAICTVTALKLEEGAKFYAWPAVERLMDGIVATITQYPPRLPTLLNFCDVIVVRSLKVCDRGMVLTGIFLCSLHHGQPRSTRSQGKQHHHFLNSAYVGINNLLAVCRSERDCSPTCELVRCRPLPAGIRTARLCCSAKECNDTLGHFVFQT